MPKAITHNSKLSKRPPVVTFMGHIDHGKTSLLDKILSSHITQKEAGGVTQGIYAYQIEHQGYKMTLIDTPGHQAFSAMRSRGAKITDIAVLVIAATEGVKEQTKECIKLVVENQIPTIVVLNKIDLIEDKFSLEKIKKELSTHGLLIEEWGGKAPLIKASAKTGDGVEDLLEMIVLLAETLDLKANTKGELLAIVLESGLSEKEGPIATLLIKDGTLKLGDKIFAENSQGKIKAILETVSSKKLSSATPSMPVKILGLKNSPAPGAIFSRKKNNLASPVQKKSLSPFVQKINQQGKETANKFNLILKAETPGALEALLNSLISINSTKIALNIVYAGVGQVNKDDLNKADLTNSAIFTFRTKTSAEKIKEAKEKRIYLKSFDIIFKLKDALIEELKSALPNEFEELPLGKLKVLALFKVDKNTQIIGGKVIDGEIRKNCFCRIKRAGESTEEEVKIYNLEHNKKPQDKIQAGFECGLKVEAKNAIQAGDMLECFEKKEKEKKL